MPTPARNLLALATLLLLAGTAHAVIVHGVVTTPLGRPVPGARIQLVGLMGTARSVADTVSGVDGSYEIRTDQSGRFLLLTSSVYYAPQLSPAFYAGRTDILIRNLALDPVSIAPQRSTLPDGLPIPQAQLATPTQQTQASQLLPRALITDEPSFSPAAFLRVEGQLAQQAELSLRGASPADLAVLVDGEPLNQLGRPANLARLSAAGLSASSAEVALDLAAGPNPFQPLTAAAGTLSLDTPRSNAARSTLDFAGDAGNLHTWHNEATVSLTRRRADLLATVSRFDTSNALPLDALGSSARAHTATAAANLGYNISGNTTLRVTARQDDSAAPLPIPYSLGLQPLTRDAAQNTVGTFTFDTRSAGNWHNQLLYGLLRAREQTLTYANPAGRPITLTAANGYTVSGTAAPFPLPPRQDQATDRDDLAYTTDYPFKHNITGLLEARYADERALDAIPTFRESLERRNLSLAATLQGELHHRLFAQTSGELLHSTTLGLLGTPRVGLTYVPVLPGQRRFRGTALHLTLASGLREPTLPQQAAQQQTTGILVPARTRSLAASVEQTMLRERLFLTATYFHNQFSHQPEPLSQSSTIPGEPFQTPTQAYRTQGLTLDARYHPRPRVLLAAGYTYLASLVEQSSTVATVNPAFPTVPIGALAPLLGSRPFHRPPNTGYATASYGGRILTASLQASAAGRSDGTTGTAQTPSLLLPNRNLNHGYTRLDASLSFALTRRFSAYTQADNLLNNQHLGDLGYPSAPLTVRAGLRIRIGGE